MAKERPILFNTEMVQAILAGKKTQTRRLLKDKQFIKYADDDETIEFLKATAICPFGGKGDKLWVRETWQTWALGWVYKASYGADLPKDIKWKSSLFMPKEACRIKLKITDVRIERLHEITDADAREEGIKMVDDFNWKDYVGDFSGFDFDAYITSKYGKNLSGEVSSYASLWSQINGLDSWQSNPWVWVITFEKEGGERC